MKKLSFILVVILALKMGYSQNVEKNITGVQFGLFGLELYNESRIGEKLALRSQLGLNSGGFWAGSSYKKPGFVIAPSINLEPKYYYNINKRSAKGKNIKNNSANYISIQAVYIPNWFVISNYDNVEVSNQISLIPTFGIRRNFGKNFNYEFKVGYGYNFLLEDNTSGSGTIDLGFKIGYDF